MKLAREMTKPPRETVPAKLVDIIATQLNVGSEEVTFDSKLREDLSADSLDIVELVLDLEQHYNVRFEEKDEDTLERDGVTVRDLVNILKTKGV